jgi:hypothetical protein
MLVECLTDRTRFYPGGVNVVSLHVASVQQIVVPQFACRLACLTATLTLTVGLRRWNAVGTSLQDHRMQHYGDAALLSPIVTVFHQISSSRLHSPKCHRDTLSARASACLDSKPIEQQSSTVLKRTAAGSVDQSVPFLHALSERAVSCMAAVVWQSECTS